MPETFPRAAENAPAKPDIAEIAARIRREYEPPDPSLRRSDQEARALRIRFLQNDPAFSALLKILNGDPALQSEIKAFLLKKDETKEGTVATPSQRHRELAPLFAGLLSSKDGQDLFELALQRSVDEEAEQIRESIKKGNAIAREAVIGTGVHATIYETERVIYRPNDPSLMIEREAKIGGQFAQPNEAVWGLNSRLRPKDLTQASIPGTAGALNDLGDNAVLHESDIGFTSYEGQDRLAKAIEVNCRLSGGKLLNNTEVLSFRRNPDADSSEPFVITSLNTQTGELIETKHDRLIYMGGLGKETTGLDEDDPETAELLAEAYEQEEGGELPQIVTFPMYAKFMGDRTKAFPMEGTKEAVLVGEGDGARIIAGALLGHEKGIGKQSAQLHFLERLDWISQSATTRKEFFAKERPRYVASGLDFPRPEEAENYFSRVKTGPGLRAVRLRRNGNKIEVLCQAPGSNELIVGGSGDRVFLPTGFRDRSEILYGALYAKKLETESDIRDNVDQLFSRVGNSASYKGGMLANGSLEVVDIVPKRMDLPQVTCRVTSADGTLEMISFKNSAMGRKRAEIERYFNPFAVENPAGIQDIGAFFRVVGNTLRLKGGRKLEVVNVQSAQFIPPQIICKIKKPDGQIEKLAFADTPEERARVAGMYGYFKDIERLELVPDRIPSPDIVRNTKGKPIARQLAASKDGEKPPEIYIGGPSAKLPLTEAEQALPAYKIGPNTASIFRYTEPTQELARLLAKRDQDQNAQPIGLSLPTAERQKIPLGPVSRLTESAVFTVPRERTRGREQFPLDMNAATAFRLAIAEITGRYKLPRSFLEKITEVTCEVTWRTGTTDAYEVTIRPGLSRQYQAVFEEIVADPLVQRACAHLMSKRAGTQKVILRIPVQEQEKPDTKALKRKTDKYRAAGKDIATAEDYDKATTGVSFPLPYKTQRLARFDIGNITYTVK